MATLLQQPCVGLQLTQQHGQLRQQAPPAEPHLLLQLPQSASCYWAFGWRPWQQVAAGVVMRGTETCSDLQVHFVRDCRQALYIGPVFSDRVCCVRLGGVAAALEAADRPAAAAALPAVPLPAAAVHTSWMTQQRSGMGAAVVAAYAHAQERSHVHVHAHAALAVCVPVGVAVDYQATVH